MCAANTDVVYASADVALITYEQRFVPRYHEWMSDEETRRMTCSEELSLVEEYETRAQWAKCVKRLPSLAVAEWTLHRAPI